jgi:radical SAM protein with 4Fe4S-binding SPASM domain
MRNRLVRYVERLFGRYAWFRRIHHPRVMVRLMRPTRSHWSGLQVRCWRRGEADGHLQVTVWRLSRHGLERLRQIKLSLAAIDDIEPCPIYWEPMTERPGLCLVTLRQRSDHGHRLAAAPLVFSWKTSEVAAIHSEPEPHLPLPFAILFSPVTQCNLNCIHCISRHSRDRLATFSDEAWNGIKAAAATGGLVHLRTDYSGDLLFADRRHGDWLRRIEDLGVTFGMDTHANDLTPDYVDRLLRSRLVSINFSLDSMDPDDYPRIRRGARPLSEVIANIRQFMTERHARRPDIDTNLSFVLMRRNLDSLHAAIDLAADLGIDRVLGNHLHAYTTEMAEESLQLQPGRYARAHAALLEYARLRQVDIALPAPVRPRPSRRTHLPCPYPWKTMAVLGNGDVMACCVPGTKVGNLQGSSLEEVWNGQAMRQFRSRVNTADPPDACTVCPMARLPNNYAAYVPGLPEPVRQAFEQHCEAAERGH